MKKTYKDLSPEDELELVLWLGFLEDSIHNAHVQIERWKQLKSGWDLQMFFVAVNCIDDAANGLKRFLSHGDSEFWSILKKFKKMVLQKDIKRLRNNIIHREKLSKLQDEKGNPLPPSPLLILGAYLVDSDEYQFGMHRIKVSDSFDMINLMTQELQFLSSKRLAEFYQNQTGSVEGMIPFTYLHHFPIRKE